MAELPNTQTLLLELADGVLYVTLNRPDSRNAMSLAMVEELRAVLRAVRGDQAVRALVLRGAGGHFCAGGDIKDMAGARAKGGDAYRELNRAFGSLLEEAQYAPQVLVAVLEGAVLGGGFGLACVSDTPSPTRAPSSACRKPAWGFCRHRSRRSWSSASA
jgi:isohexenylglutaconyl-CoA hydratase